MAPEENEGLYDHSLGEHKLDIYGVESDHGDHSKFDHSGDVGRRLTNEANDNLVKAAITYFEEKGIDVTKDPQGMTLYDQEMTIFNSSDDQELMTFESSDQGLFPAKLGIVALGFYFYVQLAIEESPKTYVYEAHGLGLGVGALAGAGTCNVENSDIGQLMGYKDAHIAFATLGGGATTLLFDKSNTLCLFGQIGLGLGAFYAYNGNWLVMSPPQKISDGH